MKRRTKHEIYMEILKGLSEGTKRAIQIMYQARLSYAQTKSYLDFLLRNNLVYQEEQYGKKVYGITPKGKELLENYKKIQKAIAEV